MKKKTIFTLSVVLLTMSVVLLFVSCSTEKKLKIGCISPFSGNGAVYGEALKEGFQIALADFMKKNPTLASKIEIIYEDDQLESKAAVSAIKKLINIDKVQVIIGAFTSNSTLAIAPIAEESKIVLLSPTATNYKIKNAGDYVFRVCPSDDLQGKIQAEYAKNILNVKTASILFMNTDYGAGLKESFKETFEQLGGKILSSEGFPMDESEFRTQLIKIKELNPEIIFLPSNWKEAANAVNQAKQLNINIQILCTDGTYDSNFLELTKGSSEGLKITTMSWGEGQYKEESDIFKRKFLERYNKEPGVYSALCYDALMIVLNVLNNYKNNANDIKEGLYKTELVGTTGLTKFDSYGEVNKDFNIYTVIDNKFVIIE